MVITQDIIEDFLHGKNPLKYVVGVEVSNKEKYADVIVRDLDGNKKIIKQKFKPYVWFKESVGLSLFKGKKLDRINMCAKYGVKIKPLTTKRSDGFEPDRLKNGYKYIAICDGTFLDLVKFFKLGGVDLYDREGIHSKGILKIPLQEQFLIQSGIRLFKGFDDYNDLIRLQFDLETEGLNAKKDRIFQIGIRTNKGYEIVLESSDFNNASKDDAEKILLLRFFDIIDEIKPDIISGYNSENFDWEFIFKRCEILSINIEDIARTLRKDKTINRIPAKIKIGQDIEEYTQTLMYGYNITDISHSVKRAMAINSDIQEWGLKYITKSQGVQKSNRVYIRGSQIYNLWSDTENKYIFNENNGDWFKLKDGEQPREGFTVVTGKYIVQRYLLDDLWETEKVDNIFNQATFLIGKILPTTYSRSSTMGTAGQWQLIMLAWSYENDLAIPELLKKEDFTGGLSRLLVLGHSENVVKFDFAALYPKSQLTEDIFPDIDISGVMRGLLTYVVDTRDTYKFLMEEKKELLEKDPKNNTLKQEINALDKKQLPLKILANSWFGSYGAPYLFNWGSIECAEETTCVGRQYLRFMIKFFVEKYKFKPLVLDTDGVNFSTPQNINEVTYLCKGTHWKTNKYKGQTMTGIPAVLAEFNENYMKGRMGLDIDDVYTSTINFSRKNYANKKPNGKVKFVGNSIKNKLMPKYVDDFLKKGIKLLLDGKGYEFIEYYQKYVDDIYEQKIPLVFIASKSKVKKTIGEYKKYCDKTNKNGNPMPRQAHMELLVENNINAKVGDIVYYVNIGTAKSHGDTKSTPNGVQLNCKLLNNAIIEEDFDILREIDKLNTELNKDNIEDNRINEIEANIEKLKKSLNTGEYNVFKYIDIFNNKVKPLLVCFNEEIRSKILLDIVKDKKTKITVLSEKPTFSREECKLVSTTHREDYDIDDYETDLMQMEDSEIKFWLKVGKIPVMLDEDKWNHIKDDYNSRINEEKENVIREENKKLKEIIDRLEIIEICKFEDGFVPNSILDFCYLNDDGLFYSIKYCEPLLPAILILNNKNVAIDRDNYYTYNNIREDNNRYDIWLKDKNKQPKPNKYELIDEWNF